MPLYDPNSRARLVLKGKLATQSKCGPRAQGHEFHWLCSGFRVQGSGFRV